MSKILSHKKVGILAVIAFLSVLLVFHNVSDHSLSRDGLRAAGDFKSSTKTNRGNMISITDTNMNVWDRAGPTKERRLPDCIIIGVRKAGTRAMLEYLGAHPDVAIAPLEVNYFDRKYNRGPAWYLQQMPLARRNQTVIEKTPNYFADREVPERIRRMGRWVKLILIVRDPVERLVSEYVDKGVHQGRSKGRSFEEMALDKHGKVKTSYGAVKTSCYARRLPNWQKYFRRQQFHIVDGDALIENPLPELKKVERFLELRPYFDENFVTFDENKGFYCYHTVAGEKQCLGKSKGHAHPNVSRDVIETLTEFYKPWNAKFYHMVGREFSWPT